MAVQVFEGNTSDPVTVGPVIEKLRRRFGLSRVVLVEDRGILTQARIREDLQPSGLDHRSERGRPSTNWWSPEPCRFPCLTK